MTCIGFRFQVVAVDRENDSKLLAFQHLSTRERGSKDGSSVSLQNIKVSKGNMYFTSHRIGCRAGSLHSEHVREERTRALRDLERVSQRTLCKW